MSTLNSDLNTPEPLHALDALDVRRSTPSRLLGAPGPSSEQVERMLCSAVRVPDHGRLTPWRFLSVSGDTRYRLGELLAIRSCERDPSTSPSAIEKDRLRFSYAPLILIVIARLTPDHKVPEIEQMLSGGAVCFALLQAAQAMGFGAQWLTGWAAYDSVIAKHLGLTENERILGFIHIGTPKETLPERERPDPCTLLSALHL